jgi:DNA-binding protein HU-beta
MAVKPASNSTVPLSKVASELAAKRGMTKKDATGALDDFVELVAKHLKKGNKVRITGLGVLQVRTRFTRKGLNPATGGAVTIRAPKKIAFSVAKDLGEAMTDPIEKKFISRVERLVGDRQAAEAWFNYEPLPAFDNRTARQLVAEGRAKAVKLHLDTLEDGGYA